MEYGVTSTKKLHAFAFDTSTWLVAGAAFAADFGTTAEAKAMLEKAVVAMKADKAAALAIFNKDEADFKDRDLYPFCSGADGNFTAHPSLVGKSIKDLERQDRQGHGRRNDQDGPRGQNRRGQLHVAPPGHDPAGSKRVRDQVCAVGYYE